MMTRWMRSYLEIVNEKKASWLQQQSGLLALAPQAGKASDEFTPLLSFIDGKDINDKGVRYYLSIRCASLYAYFAGLMQDRDANTSKAYTDSAMGLLEAAALNSYSTNNDMEKSFTYAQRNAERDF